MADLSLKIKADFEEASRQFKTLAESSEDTRKKIEKFSEKFKTESIDRFIERQDLMSAAMQATGRETEAINAQVGAYQREIERLIKSGLDPQDEALQKLQSQYSNLLTKQDEMKQSAEAEARAAERLAETTVKLLDAETEHEKTIIKLSESKKQLRSEIEKLIKSGISPESEEVKELEGKYKELTREIKENEAAHKAQEAAVKAAAVGLAAIGATLAAGAGFALKAAAANEDMIASFVPMMDGSLDKATELFKTIQKEAATTPFEIDKIAASVRTLMPAFGGSAEAAKNAFRMLGDTAQGNAQKLESITRAYTQVMLKGKVSMQELNTIAGAGVPIYTELAASLGVTEERMMEMSKKGEIMSQDLTDAFKQMTGEGGIFFEGMVTSSDTLSMRLLGVKENVGILAGVIGEKLLPAAKNMAGTILSAVESFTDWIQEGDNFDRMARGLSVTIAAATAALTAFLLVSKKTAIINAMAGAIKGLMAAITGPAGIAALAIGALAAGIGMLVAHEDKQKKQGEVIAKNLLDQKSKADLLLSAYSGLNPAKEVDAETTKELIKLYPELSALMEGNAVTVKELQETVENIDYKKATESAQPFIDSLIKTSEEIKNIEERIEELKNKNDIQSMQTKGMNQQMLDRQLRLFERYKKNANDILASIGMEVDIENNFAFIETIEKKAEKLNETIKQQAIEAAKTISQKLNEIGLTEQQTMTDRINQTKSFLTQRADLEMTEAERSALGMKELAESRIKAVLDEHGRIIQSGKLKDEELIAAERAASEVIKQIREDLAKAEEIAAKKSVEDKKNEDKEKLDLLKNSLQERIDNSVLAQSAEQAIFAAHLQQCADMEGLAGQERIEFIRNIQSQLLADEENFADNKVAIERAAAALIKETEEKLAEEQKRIFEQKMNAAATFFNGIGQLLQIAGEENRAAAIAAKAVAMVEAGINTALAATKALTGAPYPWNLALMAGTIAQGVAQQIKIATASIPSAETGGHFVVPDISPRRVDGQLYRFNPGEEINVTPRGMTGGQESFIFQFIFDGEPFAYIVNKLARRGELYTLQLAGNL